jgi:hypothetical protein
MAFNEQGVRIGAAGHFASRITAALISSGQLRADHAMDTFADYTAQALDVLNGLEAGAPAQATVQAAPQAAPQLRSVPAGLADMVDTTTVVTSHAAQPEIVNASTLAAEGIDNGPLPAWLGPICAKYGVGKVFDNRHQLAGEGAKRPWFRQAGVPQGGKAKGFWPDSK